MSPGIMPIIPYFIGLLVPDNLLTMLAPVYTFRVDISTLFKDVMTYEQAIADVSFDLKCQLVTNNNLRCYIPESSIYYTSSKDYKIDNEITPSHVIYSHVNFTMEFDDMGVTNLDTEKLEENFEDMEDFYSVLMIYDMIGDLLSIGAHIERKGDEFYEMERTRLGMCPTFYKFLEAKNPFQLNYTLSRLTQVSYSKSPEEESVEIRKYRSIQECCANCNRILGMILWTDLFLSTDYTVSMMKSRSEMLLDKHYFYSSTDNFFQLFDIDRNLVGHVVEKLKITLWTVDT